MLITIVDYGEIAIFIIMGLASVLALAVFIDRYFVFLKSTKKEKVLISKLTEQIRLDKYEEISNLSETFKSSIYSRFCKLLVENYKKGEKSLMELIDGRVIIEKINLEKRLIVLNTLGNNAPFIGLLGTVLGIIKAFDNLGSLGSSGAEAVMKSISTALFATAFGLAIAIPIVIANNYFTRKIKVIIANMEFLGKEFLANLSKKGGS